MPRDSQVFAEGLASVINKGSHGRFHAESATDHIGNFVVVRGPFRNPIDQLSVRLYFEGDSLWWDIAEEKIGHSTESDAINHISERSADHQSQAQSKEFTVSP